MPRRGEIWLVALDPAKGDEMRKTRPALVVSSDAMGVLGVKLVVPLTGCQPSHDTKLWLVPVDPSDGTGLSKRSSADTLQMRSVALERFRVRLGRMPAALMEEIAAAIAVVVEYQ
ncbi:MAG: type II toxin-antitoxin system PemK/MazF family toxin [Chloroflexales bacterium]|nr:type II toxin-antitoxin system PemK/MazF family toxin [Chloroflexales bacterium]